MSRPRNGCRCITDSADSNGDIDEAVHLKGGLVSATVTITDGDGDTASASADISHDIQFEDDGPTIIGTALGEPKLTVDESFIPMIGSQQLPSGSNVASADFSHQFFVNAGVDGEKSLTYALTLNNAATGLIDSLTGTAVTLHSVDATHIQALDGNNDMVFTLTVDSGGVVTLTDLRGVHEDALSNTSNDSITLPTGLVSLSATVTDGDGDQASASVDLGHAITIKDDGPHIISAIASGTVAQDETPGVQDAGDPNPANDVAGIHLPTGILNLFTHVANPGTDLDVNPALLDNGALGFATSSSPIVQVNADFGADGPALSNSEVLSLAINGGNGTASGLFTTDGHPISLFIENGLIVGRYDGNGDGHITDGASNSFVDPAAFAIELGQDGNISVAQYVSLKNPIPGSSLADLDEPTTGLKNVQAVVTIKDGDGDTASDSQHPIDISNNIVFQDDGPTLTVTTPDSVSNSFFFDGFTPNGDVWGTGSGIDTGPLAGSWTIADANVGHSGSDLIADTGNGTVQLERVGDGYEGMHSSTHGFMVDLDASPHDIKISQVINGLTNGESYQLTFEAGAPFPGEAHLEVWFGGVKVDDIAPTGTMQTYSLELFGDSGNGSNLLEFRETGTPDNQGTYLANVKMADVIVIDETPGHDSDSNETTDSAVINLFSTVAHPGVDPDMPPQYATGSTAAVNVAANFGADGPLHGNAATATSYTLTTADGTDSGLQTTEGKEIFLFSEGGLVVGRFDSNGDSHVDGADNAAFALTIDANGVVSVAQYVSLHQPDTTSNDEGVYLNGGTLSAAVTITDGDGDTATQSADISGIVRFEDDGPSIDPNQNSSLRDWTLDEDVLAPNGNDAFDTVPDTNDYTLIADKNLGVTWGADGPGTLSLAAIDSTHPTIGIADQDGNPIGTPLSSGGVALVYDIETNPDGGQTLTATKGTGGPEILTLTLDPDGGPNGTFTFDLLGPLDDPAGHGENRLDLTFGFTATDGDGDPVSSQIIIRVVDDVPHVVATALDVAAGDFSFNGFTLNGDIWGIGSGVDTGTTSGGWTIGTSGTGNDGGGALQLERVGDGYDGSGGSPMHTSTHGTMVDLDASPHDLKLSQTVHLTSGETTLLTFEAGAPFPAEAHLQVYFGGQLIDDIAPTDTMQTYTVALTGGFGDHSNLLEFRETGTPDNHGTYLANVKLNGLIIDETPGVQADSNETTDPGVINLFSGVANPGADPDMPPQFAQGTASVLAVDARFGADGPAGGNAAAATTYTLSTPVDGTDSGLKTTEGKTIELFNETNGGDHYVVGRFDSDGNGHIDGSDQAAFALTIDSTGVVSVALYVSLEHPDQANIGNGFESYDEGIYLNNGTLSANVTITDFDGDTATQGADISGLVRFEDDGPTVSGVTYDQHGPNLIVNGSFEQGHAELTGSDWSIYSSIPGWTEGADGIPFEVQIGAAGGLAAQDGNALIELDGDTTGNPAHQPPQGTPDPVHTDATVQQTIATTAGEDYVLTFYYSPRPDHSGGNDGQPANDSGLNVLWNGVVVELDQLDQPAVGLAANHAACDRHRQ